VLSDNGKQYLARFGKGTRGNGWFSFDHKGTHFVGLNNVLNIREGGLGVLGDEQIAWMTDDLRAISPARGSSYLRTFHLWEVYPQWGWAPTMAPAHSHCLSVSAPSRVLNVHIHQVMKKTEGNATFHTAMSTAFPQPVPGSAPKPGPMKVDAGILRHVLGITDVTLH
jgi:hypothetical protein